MRGLIRMFDHTRMIVLVSVTAALYAAILIPFKLFTIIPGYTELRPASVIPLVCSLFFGPAAAWGAAFGNLLGDFGGMLGIGSLFGMLGNFLYGYIPYRVWLQRGREAPVELVSAGAIARYAIAAIASSLACAVAIAWGLDVLGLVPFVFLANVIIFNNLLFTLLLGPVLVRLLAPRIRAWGLTYQRIMSGRVAPSKPILHLAGLSLILIGGAMALGIANLQKFAPESIGDATIAFSLFGQELQFRAGTTPGCILMLVGCLLI